MSAFTALIAKAEAIIHDVTGQARADLVKVVADLKAEAAESRTITTTLLETAKTDLSAIIAAGGPAAAKDAETLIAKLEAGILKALG